MKLKTSQEEQKDHEMIFFSENLGGMLAEQLNCQKSHCRTWI